MAIVSPVTGTIEEINDNMTIISLKDNFFFSPLRCTLTYKNNKQTVIITAQYFKIRVYSQRDIILNRSQTKIVAAKGDHIGFINDSKIKIKWIPMNNNFTNGQELIGKKTIHPYTYNIYRFSANNGTSESKQLIVITVPHEKCAEIEIVHNCDNYAKILADILADGLKNNQREIFVGDALQ